MVSTGNGEGDAFAALYENAVAGTGRLRDAVHLLGGRPAPRRGVVSHATSTEAADPESARREHARTPADAFRSPEGVYFKRFSLERHVAEIDIVENWQTWRAIDFGYRHPACLWAQRSPAGQLFIVDELLPHEQNDARVRGSDQGPGGKLRPRRAGDRQLLRPGRQGDQHPDRGE